MTGAFFESPGDTIGHWQLGWQWSPSLVAGMAAVATIVAAAYWHFAPGAVAMRLSGLAARVAAITLLVVMLSGWSVAPREDMPETPSEWLTPSLAVSVPRLVRLGDVVGLDVAAVVPAKDQGDHVPTADLLHGAGGTVIAGGTVNTGETVASAPLFRVPSTRQPQGRNGGGLFRGRIFWRPDSTGTFSGTVRIRGEDSVPASAVSVEVVDEAVRVFLIDQSRFESRFLERHLARDTRTELTASIRLRNATHDDAVDVPATREAWNRFDVVVIGSADPRALPEPSAAALVEAAVRDGVGIVWSLDAASDPEAIAVSPIGRLLPFRGSSRPRPFTSPFSVELSKAGEEAAWLALVDDADESREAWRTMQSVYGPIEPTAIRPTARVMATCRPAVTPAGESSRESPLILVDQVGDARIVALLAETWRLRQGARGPLVDRLLLQTVAHAAEAHLASRLGADADSTPDDTRAGADIASTENRGLVGRTFDATTPGDTRPLWSHPVILLALLVACGIEWWIRGRLGDGP